MKRKIAIVGSGLSGSLTAINLLKTLHEETIIYLIEEKLEQFCRGVAYSNDYLYQPLNVPAGNMSLFSDESDDFIDWLNSNKGKYNGELQNLTRNSFVPRKIFGDYLTARFEEAQSKNKLVEVKKIFDEAVDVSPMRENNLYRVILKSENMLKVDKVIFAFGNFNPPRLRVTNEEFYESKFYIGNPWQQNILKTISASDPVLLIGSGLTMVDVVVNLILNSHSAKIYVISRHGLIPRTHNTPSRCVSELPKNLFNNLEELLNWIKSEILKSAPQGDSWRSVIDSLRNDTQLIWKKLPTGEKKKFLRHLRPYWDVHRHRMPAESASYISQVLHSRQLQIIPARINDFIIEEDFANVYFRLSNDKSQMKLKVKKVINCTGPESNFNRIDKPLIKNLLRNGLITTDELKLGLLNDADGKLIDKNGTTNKDLFLIGPPRKSTLWESVALRELRQQAEKLAKVLNQKEQVIK
jgi:uncharacterized NAD(P)/FAD-binding protein YdhS